MVNSRVSPEPELSPQGRILFVISTPLLPPQDSGLTQKEYQHLSLPPILSSQEPLPYCAFSTNRRVLDCSRMRAFVCEEPEVDIWLLLEILTIYFHISLSEVSFDYFVNNRTPLRLEESL